MYGYEYKRLNPCYFHGQTVLFVKYIVNLKATATPADIAALTNTDSLLVPSLANPAPVACNLRCRRVITIQSDFKGDHVFTDGFFLRFILLKSKQVM